MARQYRRGLLAILATLAGALLLFVALQLPRNPGLEVEVARWLPASGVDHQVTAVLLNFRSLDTLLEIAVLLLAAMAARALPILALPPVPVPGNRLLDWLSPRLVLLALLLATYLYWAGSTRSGGAFQGGTVLAAAGVLMLLRSGARQPPPSRWWRVLIASGLLVFVSLGAATAIFGGGVLVLSPSWAQSLILLLELALTVSIAASLIDLVGAAYRRNGDEPC